jgi:hypothetical protein
MSFEQKYRKYKQKYLELKQQYSDLQSSIEQNGGFFNTESFQEPVTTEQLNLTTTPQQFNGGYDNNPQLDKKKEEEENSGPFIKKNTENSLINDINSPSGQQVEQPQQPAQQEGGFLSKIFGKNTEEASNTLTQTDMATTQDISLSDTPQNGGTQLSPAPVSPTPAPVVAGTPNCAGNVNPVPNTTVPSVQPGTGYNQKYMADMLSDDTTTDMGNSVQNGGNTESEITNTEDIEKLFSQLGGNLSELNDSSSVLSSSSSLLSDSDENISISVSDL